MSLLADIRRDFSFTTHLDERLQHPIDRRTEITSLEALAVFWRALRYIWPFRWRFGAKLIFACGSFIPAVLYPWPASFVIDHIILGKAIGETPTRYPPFVDSLVQLLVGMGPFEMMLWIAALLLLLVALFGAFGQGGAANDNIEGYLPSGHDEATRAENEANIADSAAAGLYGLIEFRWQLRLTQALNHFYRAQLYSRIKSLPMRVLDDQRVGDTVFRVLYDTPAISQICYAAVLRIPVSLMNLGLILFIMHYSFRDVPWLVGLALVAFPVTLLTTLPFSAYKRRRQHASRAANAMTTSSLEEGMNNILAVQSLGGHKRQKDILQTDSSESFARYRGTRAADMYINLAVRLSAEVLRVLTFVIIVTAIIEGSLSPGVYLVLWYYYGWIRGAGNAMARLWIDLQDNAMGVRRVFALMDLPGEEATGGRPPAGITEGVVIENATLEFADGRRALDGVDFEGRLGEVVAIVGPTGAGKTSLAYLVPRFHQVTSGRVLIDGVDVNALDLDGVRGQISYVFQETHLFSDSVADNIRYANPEASIEAVNRAAAVAGVTEFLDRLPQGFDTPLGRAGGKLSVGQKQRISLARGLVKDARIMIFDEPTSAVDPETERFLVASLKEAARDRLVIIIAHRLSTIRSADRIYFMDAGRVLEVGSHRDLMQRPDGRYRRYVELQTGNPVEAG